MAHPAKQVHKQSTPLDRAWPKPHPIRAQTEQVASQSPDSSVLRANPFPEVTDLTCRLPVSTLFYRLEAVNLGDLLRISVRPRSRFKSPKLVFHGPSEVHETPQKPWRFTETTSLSPAEPFPGIPFLNLRRDLRLGLHSASPAALALPHMALLRAPISDLDTGILTCFPFGTER